MNIFRPALVFKDKSLHKLSLGVSDQVILSSGNHVLYTEKIKLIMNN